MCHLENDQNHGTNQKNTKGVWKLWMLWEGGSKVAILKRAVGNSLAVQWLGLHASTVGGLGLIPGQGTKIPQAVQQGKRKKKKSGHSRPH